jgi:hypothetical protein
MRAGQHATEEQVARCTGSLNSNWKGGKVERICLQCGEKFLSKRSANRKYCSGKCFHEAQFGHPVSDKGLAALSTGAVIAQKRNTGTHRSPETKKKISVASTAWQIGKKGPLNNHYRGGKHLNWARTHSKRRDLAFLPLNLWFPDCEGHHLDHDHVLYIPRILHQSVSHNHTSGRGMEQINALALAYAGLSSDVLNDALPFN